MLVQTVRYIHLEVLRGGALSRTSQKKYRAWIRAGPHNQMWPEGENGAGREEKTLKQFP